MFFTKAIMCRVLLRDFSLRKTWQHSKRKTTRRKPPPGSASNQLVDLKISAMKKIFFLILFTITCQWISAQNVGIGTATSQASAQLDVSSTTKGILIPRMTTAQRTAIATPVLG